MCSDSELARELREVAERYLLQLRQELSQLQGLLRSEPGPPATALLRELRERCHRLAGSSASFGYVELGAELRRTELRLQALIEDGLSEYTSLRSALLAISEPVEAPPLGAVDSLSAVLTEPERRDSHQRAPVARIELAPGDLRVQLESLFQGLGIVVEQGASELKADLRVHWMDASSPMRIPASSHEHGHLLVIAGRDSFEARLAAVRAGAAGFFALPLDALALERRIDLLLQRANPQPYRVLLVDDDPLLLQRNAATLQAAGMQAFALEQPQRLLEELERVQPDVLVLDLNMPDCDGLELAQTVRFSDVWLQMPIVYLSADASDARQRAALATAGEDFLLKPVAAEALVANVLGRARRARSLAQGLSRDGLTGLLRHAEVKEQLAQALARACRDASPLCVALLDLDHFKRVNDRYGHAAGDRVLRSLASLIRLRARRGDAAGRYGGEEFLLVLPGCRLASACELVDQLRVDFAAATIEHSGRRVRASFSAGVAEWQGEESADSLLARADEALYRAKQAGRNRVEAATEGDAAEPG
jgi:diguanylate cyclase (GGDEF)-like protein